jgi:hydroxymethylpyrimidine pyrophosphatase-like HAD family hydrolase
VPSGEVPGLFHIHLTDNRANKGKAVHELAKMVGVDPSEMLAAGDGRNDIGLFEAVGYKVAMSNAADELKQIADRVIGDVADDGLAEYLEELAAEIANKVV